MENAIYVVKTDKLQEVAKPKSGHGKHIIISRQGDNPCQPKLEKHIKF
jgi:CMP-2-keto-3-deoxyoctulosonic acid synthetase